MEIGKDYARMKTDRLLDGAPKKSLELRKYIQELIDKNQPLPAVISPSGEYFITDGHHTILSYFFALGKNAKLNIKLEIIKDYRQPRITKKDPRKSLVWK